MIVDVDQSHEREPLEHGASHERSTLAARDRDAREGRAPELLSMLLSMLLSSCPSFASLLFRVGGICVLRTTPDSALPKSW